VGNRRTTETIDAALYSRLTLIEPLTGEEVALFSVFFRGELGQHAWPLRCEKSRAHWPARFHWPWCHPAPMEESDQRE